LYANGGKVARSRPGEFQVGNPDAGVGVAVTMGITGNALFGGTGIVTATSFKLADGSTVGGVTSDSDGNTVGGTDAGNTFTSGEGLRNSLFGLDAGKLITTGDNNVAVGAWTLDACNTGRFNTAVGSGALGGLTGGTESTAFGYDAGSSGNGNKNVFMGFNAGQSVTSGSNTIVGYEAGKANNTTGDLVAFGMEAAHNSTSSQRFTALGYQAGKAASAGNGNTYVGYKAGYLNVNGNANTCVGDQTVKNSSDFQRATVLGQNAASGFGSNANDNIVIGYNAGTSTLTGTNNILIGASANLSGNVSNEITLGDANITKFRIPGPSFQVVKNSTSDHMIMLGTTDSSAGAWSSTRQGLKLVGSQPLVYYVDDGNTSGDDAYVGHAGSSLYIAKKGGSVTFQTSASGAATASRWYINSTGHFIPSSDANYDIGTSSARVRNVYTNDLNLSNEGHKNDVDGTWGNYTIQEGEDDLFLINRRSGKKYKFNLTEVP